MALNIIGAAVRNLSFKYGTIVGSLNAHPVKRSIEIFIKPHLLNPPLTRNISFLNKSNLTFVAHFEYLNKDHLFIVSLCVHLFSATGQDLWKSCTTVSNAGRKRGRARRAGKGLTKHLNKGQVIGVGRKNLILPGLNTRVRAGYEIASVGRGADDPAWYVHNGVINTNIATTMNIFIA